jgi:hypothetical protein
MVEAFIAEHSHAAEPDSLVEVEVEPARDPALVAD